MFFDNLLRSSLITHLLSNWVNRVLANSNVELDVGSFTANLSCNSEILNENSDF